MSAASGKVRISTTDTVVAPSPKGWSTSARHVQESFHQALGQSIVIDNRGGAAGSLGTDLAAKSASDG